MALFPGDRTCAGHVSGAVEIRRQHSCVPIRAGKTVIVTCLPCLEPRSFPALFALHRAGTDIGGEILQRWRSLYEAHSPSPSARVGGVFHAATAIQSAATGRKAAECRGLAALDRCQSPSGNDIAYSKTRLLSNFIFGLFSRASAVTTTPWRILATAISCYCPDFRRNSRTKTFFFP
jgi:hypothetical protein